MGLYMALEPATGEQLREEVSGEKQRTWRQVRWASAAECTMEVPESRVSDAFNVGEDSLCLRKDGASTSS